MDNNIRQLLTVASQQSCIDAGDGSFLHLAYRQLEMKKQSKSTADGSLPFGQDLFVICAEIALQRGESTIASESLKMFFMKSPPPNQFLCRAYLCHAQLLAPVSAGDKDQLEKAVVFILKALNFAKVNPRYHFLVYNASVLYWQFCRPFMKPTYRRCLASSLHSVVQALGEVGDSDHEWRAQLMVALIECHLDAGHLKEAAEVSRLASELTKNNIPALYREVLALQIRYNLVDSAKLAKDLKQNCDLSAFYRIMKLRVGLEQKEIIDVEVPMAKLISQLLKEEDLSRPSSVLGPGGRKTPVDERPITTPSLPASAEGLTSRGSTLTSIQAAADVGRHVRQAVRTDTPQSLSNEEHKSAASKWKVSASPRGQISEEEKPRLLLEMAHLCAEYDQPQLLKRCLEGLRTFTIVNKTIYLSMEFLECELMVRELGFTQEMYTKKSVEVRLQAIGRLSEAVTNAVRSADPGIIQVGCVTMWNICLPLLQSSIRSKVRKPLALVADASQDINSLLIPLRCQLHTELAKIEEDEEQIEVAMEHLRKALCFDNGGQYSERLQTSLHRLRLRAELYKPPERNEDKAAMIIEQARKSSGSGTMRKRRALLVRAGQALSPDAFMLVLESESETKGSGGGAGVQTLYSPSGAKAEHYNRCAKKAAGHIKRLGAENDKERAHLWADLAKTARKQEVWDVCRVAARFCLLYDDDRWKALAPQARPGTRQDSDLQPPDTAGVKRIKSASQQATAADISHTDRDLIRMLVEINFINSEALIHLLRSENVELKNDPTPPVDTSKKPQGYVAIKPEENKDWIKYRDWIHDLNESCLNGFLRGAELGVQLSEPWAVCSATAYVWNYCSHLLQANRHRVMVPYFKTLLGYMKQVGHAGKSSLVVNLCDALATGLLTPWMQTPQPDDPSPDPRGRGNKEDLRKAKSVTSHTSTKSKTVLSDPEAVSELKQALEVCEFALKASSGSRHVTVRIAVKHSLLMTWVKVKQLLSQQVTETLGSEDEDNVDGQTFVTRCLVALEILTLNGNGLASFKEAPVLEELCNMVTDCQWPDALVELQVWTRMSHLALKSRNHPLVSRCSERAFTFDLPDRIRRVDSHSQMVWYELLSHAANTLGQSYILGMIAGSNTVRRQALETYVKAAKYAEKAGNAALVITVARRYWNACLTFVTGPMERQLLQQSLVVLLRCISVSSKENKSQKLESKGSSAANSCVVAGSSSPSGSLEGGGPAMGDILSNPEDDLSLRSAMYGVLFQSYIDQGEYEEALSAMDKAVRDMPRTKHRLLIFKHRLMVKAKLGRDIHVDIAKFKDESEDYVGLMWYKVAINSRDKSEQITAYQNAINNLKLPSSDWQKAEYILEFAEWLHINEYPLGDCMDQLDWAIDILLKMKVETHHRTNTDSAKSHKGRKGRKSASQKSHSSEDAGPAEVSSMTSDLSVNLTQLRSIKLLDHLIRASIILALVADRGSPRHQEACLMACGLLNRIWQVALPSAANLAREQVQAAALQEQSSSTKTPAKGKSGTAKDAKGAKFQEAPKPKHKGPLDALPTSCEDWASYELPAEIREAFKEDDSGEGINKDTITAPTLSLHYLLQLTTEMRAAGYNHLVFPALILAEVIARDICSSNTTGDTCKLILIEVCTELNLTEAYRVHESVVGSPGLSDAEQASSREEVALLQEKQVQIERESERTQELQRQMLLNSQGGGKPLKCIVSSKMISAGQKISSIKSVTEEGLCEHLSSVTYRQAWTQQAEVLIRLGYYQAAREFLNEALISAEAFSDNYYLVHILTDLAELAYMEGDYRQCMDTLWRAQMVEGHEELWLKYTQLLVDATLADRDDTRGYIKADAVLAKAVSSFENLMPSRPNKDTKLRYITAEIKSKLSTVRLDQILENGKNTLQTSIHGDLVQLCEMLQECSSAFMSCGYRRRAAEVMDQHAGVLRLFARDSSDAESRHRFLLHAYSVSKQAVDILDLELSRIPSRTPRSVGSTLSLPLERETSDIKNSFGDLLIEMFAVYAREHRQLRIQDSRKTSVEKMVAEYTAVTPDLSDTEKQWQQIAGLMGQTAIVHLTAAVELAGQYVPLKAKSLLNLGRCFHAIGSFYSPSSSHQWDVHYMSLANTLTGAEESQETAGGDRENQPTTQQTPKMEKLTSKFKLEQGTSEKFISQAMEVLTQCIQVSLQQNLRDMIAAAALQLVEICGQFDQPLATQYLALYQSCEASTSMEALLSSAQLDPSTSQQASLLHQQRIMARLDVTTNWSNSTMAAAIRQTLGDTSEAWRRLKVDPRELDTMKEFPANIIILQHNRDRSILYGALLERQKSLAGKETGKGKTIPAEPSKARIIKVSVDPMAIQNLADSMSQHKAEVMQTLFQLQARQSQHAQRLQMLENLTNDMKESFKDFPEDSLNAEKQLQENFTGILKDFEDYLRPITTYFEPMFSGPDRGSSIAGKDLRDMPPEESVVILADEVLLQLPLEALSLFTAASIGSVSRDFSLQMLYHRLHTEPEAPPGDDADDKKKRAAAAVAKEKAAKEKDKNKAIKMVPIDRTVPPHCIPLDTNGFKYIIDPYCDVEVSADGSPIRVTQDALQLYQNQFTARWEGIMGDDHVPSLSEWEQHITDCGSFLFYGTEQFLSHLPPSRIAPMDLKECNLALLLDMAQTSNSFMRQSKIDVQKSYTELSLEKPVDTAMLLSLAGVNCILANQWHCSTSDNAQKFKNIMKALLEAGLTPGQAIRQMATLSNTGEEGEESSLKEWSDQPQEGGSRKGSKSAGSNDGKTSKIGQKGKKSSTERRKSEVEAKIEKESDIVNVAAKADLPTERRWYNAVCYGLPNLMVANI